MQKTFLLLCLIPMLAACDTAPKQQYFVLARADSLRQDSLTDVRNQLLNDMLVSTQFINDINSELARAPGASRARNVALVTPAESATIRQDREEVLSRIRMVIRRLAATDANVARLRREAVALAGHDSTLMQQIAQYEQTIADFRTTLETQKQQYEAVVDSQRVQIASLDTAVDTLNAAKAALADTVGQLTEQRNTAYYIAGPRSELEHDGVIVEEGQRRFWLLGSRQVAPARSLEPAAFTRIDITKDTSIALPDGEYTIFSRQDPAFTQPFTVKNGKIAGGLNITNPRAFWAPSRFLILVKQ
ncbi:MAG: hypothetical protein KGO03_04305 [Gemmatimonadota bacterium]|nr:hypothetical protein [Gemmatimonadota bacterium]